MGHYVHLHVCFACDDNDDVAPIARRHLERGPIIPPSSKQFAGDGGEECDEARWFLQALASRTGKNPGPKGGLSMWGIVGNWSTGEHFVEALMPFWRDLLIAGIENGDYGGPCEFEHVLVFVEPEQTGKAKAFEVFLDDVLGKNTLTVKEHDCPFSWAQY